MVLFMFIANVLVFEVVLTGKVQYKFEGFLLLLLLSELCKFGFDVKCYFIVGLQILMQIGLLLYL